jgi:16S rRNA (guanine966-N2)-methyltransferase
MREALFSSLGQRVEGARIADLFAGTGAYGLEAMSRGASSGLFVESCPRVAKCLNQNLQSVAKSCGAKATDWRALAKKVETIPPGSGYFDILFIDPPYEIIEARLPTVFSEHIAPLTHQDSIVCIEMPGQLTLSLPGWHIFKRLGKIGKDKPTITFYASQGS